MVWRALIPELILLLASLIILLAGAGRGERGAVWGKVTAAVFAAALLALLACQGPEADLAGGMLSLDSFAVLFRGIFLALGLLVALISDDFLSKHPPARAEYWPLLLWAVLGMMLMVSSRDLLMIYLGLELVSLCSYVLAGYLKEDARSVEASIKYFLTGAVASAVLLFGISLLYGFAGSTSLEAVARAWRGISTGTDAKVLGYSALAFLIVGFGFKVAAAPMHMWAPDVYEGAPTPITAFFSVGPKGAAFAALLRVLFVGLLGFRPGWTTAFAFLAAASMVVGNLAALPQKNLKRMMAYSAIAHAGYVLVGFAAGTGAGTQAVAYYLLAYVFANLGVFAVIWAVSARGEELNDYAGLGRRQPVLAWSMVVHFLSLIGIPPLAGFFGKLYLLSAALERGQVWLALVMVVNSAVSVGYYYGVVRQMFLVMEEGEDKEPHSRVGAETAPKSGAEIRVGPLVTAVAVGTAALTVALGLGVEYFLGWAAQAVAVLPQF